MCIRDSRIAVHAGTGFVIILIWIIVWLVFAFDLIDGLVIFALCFGNIRFIINFNGIDGCLIISGIAIVVVLPVTACNVIKPPSANQMDSIADRAGGDTDFYGNNFTVLPAGIVAAVFYIGKDAVISGFDGIKNIRKMCIRDSIRKTQLIICKY